MTHSLLRTVYSPPLLTSSNAKRFSAWQKIDIGTNVNDDVAQAGTPQQLETWRLALAQIARHTRVACIDQKHGRAFTRNEPGQFGGQRCLSLAGATGRHADNVGSLVDRSSTAERMRRSTDRLNIDSM
jgi:hypothetical protein